MSYAIVSPVVARRPAIQPLRSLQSQQLAQAPPASSPLMSSQLLMAIAAVVALMLLLYWLDQQNNKVTRNVTKERKRKQSTKDMARNLYKRLEERGGVNETTMRSLQQLGRR